VRGTAAQHGQYAQQAIGPNPNTLPDLQASCSFVASSTAQRPFEPAAQHSMPGTAQQLTMPPLSQHFLFSGTNVKAVHLRGERAGIVGQTSTQASGA